MAATSSGTWKGRLGADGGEKERRGGDDMVVCMQGISLLLSLSQTNQLFSVISLHRGACAILFLSVHMFIEPFLTISVDDFQQVILFFHCRLHLTQ